MIQPRLGESQQLILHHLKRHGTGTVPGLAEALGVSVETVRNHLKSLGSGGLVRRSGRQRSGPGRPEIVYVLTEAAERLFPDRAGKMLADLGTYLTEEGEVDLLSGFFDAQGEARLNTLRERIGHLEGRERLEGLARMLSEEGYMADVTEDGEGRPTLRLANCPIRPLIEVTRAPCRSELGSVQTFLGARLVRTSYMPDGDAACCYTIVDPDPGQDP